MSTLYGVCIHNRYCSLLNNSIFSSTDLGQEMFFTLKTIDVFIPKSIGIFHTFNNRNFDKTFKKVSDWEGLDVMT